VYDAQGRQIGAAHILRNVTEQVRTQQALRESEESESGRVQNMQAQIVTKNGEIKTCLFSAEQLDYRDKPCLICSGIDITERTQTEEALERMRLLMSEGQKIAHIGSFEYIAATGETIWSEEEFRIYGLKPGRPRSPSFADLVEKHFHPEDAARVEQKFSEALQKSSKFEMEHRIVRPDGSIRDLYNVAQPHFDEHGKLVKYIGATLDITERKRVEMALEAERSRLMAVLDALPAAVWIADHHGTVVQTNRAVEKIWGKQNAAYGLEKYRDFKGWWAETGKALEPEDWALARAVFKGDFPSGEIIDIERFNGERATILNNAAPVKDKMGRIIGGVAVAQDITAQKQMERSLRESEEKFRTVFEQAAVGIGRVSFDDARWIEVNDAFCRMLGYSREALLSAPWPRITHPDDVDLDWIPFRRMAAGELDSYTVEKRFIHQQGHHVWARLTLSLVRDAAQRPDYEIAVIEDINDKRTAEVALRRSEARWNTAIESFAQGAIIATGDEQVIYWNPAARKMHGFTRPDEGIEPLEKTPVTFQLWTPDGTHMLALDEWPMRRIKRGETVRDLELLIRRPDQGWEKIFSYSGAMVATAGGEQLIFLSCSDLTKLRHAEETLKASLAEKEVLLKEIHHRVKNNMQVISSLVALQADRIKDDALSDVLKEVTDRVRSMAMVHEKLYQSTDLARVDFADYTQSLVHYLWRSYGNTVPGVRLDLDLSQVFLPVNLAVPCGLILNELFSNAIKHAFRGRNGGKVNVALHGISSGRVQLSVSDNGIGLPSGMDWRQSPSLGLSLVQTLAAQMHAAVEVISTQGTEFKLLFEIQT
jgi:PAS domain S-box-containing protein